MADAATLAIAGLGAIGGHVARQVIGNTIPGLELTAAAVRDADKARKTIGPAGSHVSIVAVEQLAKHADIILECLPATVFDRVAVSAVEQGKTLVVMSAGALLERDNLIVRATETGARIVVASGAILGLDAIRAAAEGTIDRVSIITCKPPEGLIGAPYLESHGINVEGLTAPLRVFQGPVREAIGHFPANVNVAASVSLAGIGADKTTVEIWADPGIERNTHRVEVSSDCSSFTMSIENTPSSDNPRTSLMTAQSTLATLRRLVGNFVVGT